ncbi:MAG: aldehyde dehydrogenase family protein, partial [Steroidobacteraceae bacterium]|nr:aldehyde dehydrogenase family protein [Steroidobacteraceae bacterium]
MGQALTEYPMLIDGEMTAGGSGEWLESTNPATLEPLGRVPNADSRDVDAAVTAAQRAQPEWAALSVFERAGILRRLASAIR